MEKGTNFKLYFYCECCEQLFVESETAIRKVKTLKNLYYHVDRYSQLFKYVTYKDRQRIN